MDLDDVKHEKTRGNLQNLVSVKPQGHLKQRSDSTHLSGLSLAQGHRSRWFWNYRNPRIASGHSFARSTRTDTHIGSGRVPGVSLVINSIIVINSMNLITKLTPGTQADPI